MKLLYCTPTNPEVEERIRGLGYDVVFKKQRDLVAEDAQGIDVLVGMNPFPSLDLSKSSLKFVQLQTQGFNHLPKDQLEGVLVANNQGGYAIPIGEWIVAKILESYKRTSNIHKLEKDRLWQKDFTIEELTNKKVLFVGTGTIAQEAAKRLEAFGVEIYGANRSGKATEYIKEVAKLDEMEKLIPEIDVLVPVLPLTPDTEDLIDEKIIMAMKPGSVIVNISRGDVIDEEVLIREADKFLAIHLDVVKTEPLPQDSPLWQMDNVFISAHTSWVSQYVDKRRDDVIYENLRRFIEGEKPLYLVDLERGY